MPYSRTRKSRRNFLVAVGAGGAATVAAIGAKTVPQAAPATAEKAPEGKGYQASEHIRKYYRTTLV